MNQVTHTAHSVLLQELADAATKVTVGSKYRHYKSTDKTYVVTGLGFLESNEELHVIYQAQYGKKLTFIRPLRVWLEEVEWEGKTLPRFTRI